MGTQWALLLTMCTLVLAANSISDGHQTRFGSLKHSIRRNMGQIERSSHRIREYFLSRNHNILNTDSDADFMKFSTIRGESGDGGKLKHALYSNSHGSLLSNDCDDLSGSMATLLAVTVGFAGGERFYLGYNVFGTVKLTLAMFFVSSLYFMAQKIYSLDKNTRSMAEEDIRGEDGPSIFWCFIAYLYFLILLCWVSLQITELVTLLSGQMPAEDGCTLAW